VVAEIDGTARTLALYGTGEPLNAMWQRQYRIESMHLNENCQIEMLS
jgi:hypothetical protein